MTRSIAAFKVLAVAAALSVLESPAGAAADEAAFQANARAARQARAEEPGLADRTPLSAARSAPRIIGGRVIAADRDPVVWSHVASLRIDGRHACGGAFVHPLVRWRDGAPFVAGWGAGSGAPSALVTAAHCVLDSDGRPIALDRLRVAGGGLRLDGAVRTFTVRAATPHPLFDESLSHDIALLALGPGDGATLAPGHAVRSIGLPTLPDALVYTRVTAALTVSGWGRTEFGPTSDTLRTAQIPYADQDFCADAHGRIGLKIGRGAFCAGFASGGVDSCQGDSGGPVSFQHTLPGGVQRGRPLLVGVVSWGAGCAEHGLQGVYADVLSARGFLDAAALFHVNVLE